MDQETEVVKKRWIREVVPGKTFADIGGLGGSAINEMVSTALRAGAREATLVDVLPFSSPLWTDFRSRCAGLGIMGYGEIAADLEGPPVGPFEVVHCSGIVYHAANPVLQLVRLRQACSESLIFTSCVVPEKVNGFALRDGTALFIPAMKGAAREAYTRHFEALGMKIEGINAPCGAPWVPRPGVYNFGPWWWLFTADFIDSLLEMTGFEVLRREETWAARATSWFCRVKPWS